jgi:hypothetical protein
MYQVQRKAYDHRCSQKVHLSSLRFQESYMKILKAYSLNVQDLYFLFFETLR